MLLRNSFSRGAEAVIIKATCRLDGWTHAAFFNVAGSARLKLG